MSIDRADKIVALLGELTRADIGALPPAGRQLLEALEEAHRVAATETILPTRARRWRPRQESCAPSKRAAAANRFARAISPAWD
jgi:hypothetical protein